MVPRFLFELANHNLGLFVVIVTKCNVLLPAAENGPLFLELLLQAYCGDILLSPVLILHELLAAARDIPLGFRSCLKESSVNILAHIL